MLNPRLSTADVPNKVLIKRTGNTLTATGHIITAVVGAGILNLPSAFSFFGWIAGVLVLLLIGGELNSGTVKCLPHSSTCQASPGSPA